MSTRVDNPTNRALVAKLMREEAARTPVAGPTPTMAYGPRAHSPTGGYLHVPLTRAELNRFAALLEQHPTGRLPITRRFDRARWSDAIHQLNVSAGYLSPRSEEEQWRARNIPIDPSDEDEYNTRPEERGEIIGNALFGVTDYGAFPYRRVDPGTIPLPHPTPKGGTGMYKHTPVRFHFRRGRRGFYGPVSPYRRIDRRERVRGGTATMGGGPSFGPDVLRLLMLIGEDQQIAYNRASKKTKRRFDEVRAAIGSSEFTGT